MSILLKWYYLANLVQLSQNGTQYHKKNPVPDLDRIVEMVKSLIYFGKIISQNPPEYNIQL